MKRITRSLALLLIATLLLAQGVAAQTAVVDKGGLKIYNEGNVLSQSDLDTISYVAADFPLPLTIFFTSQYKGAKIDFSKQIAKLVTENNIVIGISTYKDNSVNYRYRLIGAGPKTGLSQSDLDGAQNVADKYLRDPNGPQYTGAISAVIGYLEATIRAGSSNNGGPSSNVGNGNDTGNGNTTTPRAASKNNFWDVVIGLIIIVVITWLVFLFLRWIWRQFNRSRPVARSSGGGGGGYYDGGPAYPIWLGGGHYGGGDGSPSGGGSSGAPSMPDNSGGGTFAGNFGGDGGSTSGNSGGGGGAFASVFGKDSGGSSSDSSSSGGGAFVSAVGSSVTTEVAANAAGAVAGVAVNILGGILGAVFSSGSGGSGPDF